MAPRNSHSYGDACSTVKVRGIAQGCEKLFLADTSKTERVPVSERMLLWRDPSENLVLKIGSLHDSREIGSGETIAPLCDHSHVCGTCSLKPNGAAPSNPTEHPYIYGNTAAAVP